MANILVVFQRLLYGRFDDDGSADHDDDDDEKAS